MEASLFEFYWKLVKAGYIEFDEKKVKFVAAEMGVPQGSIISPLLSNLVLHALDKFMERKIEKREAASLSSPPSRPNPKYKAVANRLTYLDMKRKKNRARGLPLSPIELKEREALIREKRKLRSTLPDTSAMRIRYVRYADDWLVGI